MVRYLHVDVAEAQTEQGNQHLFVDIHHTSKVVFIELHLRTKRVGAT